MKPARETAKMTAFVAYADTAGHFVIVHDDGRLENEYESAPQPKRGGKR